MNCHGNNNNKKHNPIKHMLMMVLCCGLPFLILAALPFISIGAGFKAGISVLVPFICPIMMLFMMIPMMFKGKKEGDCCGERQEKKEDIIKVD